MRVLVTGGTGFIGGHLTASLRREGMDCVAQPRAVTRSLPAGWAGAPFALVDLAWDTTRSPGFAAHAQQVHRLAQLVEQLRPLGLSAVIGTGSSEEYGPLDGMLTEEAEPATPLTAYGWGKRAAGELLRAWSARAGVPCLWVRPFIVYGPGQRGDMLIPYAVRQALAGLPAEFSAGEQRRDLLAVEDLVALYRRALERGWEGFHVVNAGTGEPTEMREVVLHLGELLGAGHLFRLGARPTRPGEPPLHVADPARAFGLFGWRAAVGWRDGLSRLVEGARRANQWSA
jgi:nucleoside-diphosphate-sugar epimerase